MGLMHRESFPVNGVFCAHPRKFSPSKVLPYTVSHYVHLGGGGYMPVYSVARLGTLGVVRDYMPAYSVVRKGTQGVGGGSYMPVAMSGLATTVTP